jgi:hypothetical protein
MPARENRITDAADTGCQIASRNIQIQIAKLEDKVDELARKVRDYEALEVTTNLNKKWKLERKLAECKKEEVERLKRHLAEPKHPDRTY